MQSYIGCSYYGGGLSAPPRRMAMPKSKPSHEQLPIDPHYLEKVMEHIFLGELLQECWFHRQKVVEVTRAEVDAAGYDVILEADGVIRHVQLKATRKGGSTHFQDINRRLADREGGCIIWMEYKAPPTGPIEMLYRWREAKDLPDKKGKTDRQIRLTRQNFPHKTSNIADLVDLLFPTS
jgi:hypothetical protein